MSWLTMAIGLSIIIAAAFAGLSALYPWEYSLSFGPLLPGTWMGELVSAEGGRHVVLVELRADNGEADDNLAGTVTLCGEKATHRPLA